MTTTFSELRESIIRSRAGHKNWRCPATLRQQIVAFANTQRQEGMAILKIAQQLGLSQSGLNRWLEGAEEGKLRPVRIADPTTPQAMMVLVTPGGYRLEGLDVVSATDLLRRLGC